MAIVATFLVLFFSFAVVFPIANLVGSVGIIYADFAVYLFGMVAFFYLPIFLYPLYKFTFEKGIDDFRNKMIVAFFLFLVFLILETLIAGELRSGKIGVLIVQGLSPFIGVAGLWLFVLIGGATSIWYLLLNDEQSLKLISKLADYFMQDVTKAPTTRQPVNRKPEIRQSSTGSNVKIKEVGKMAKITIESNEDRVSFDFNDEDEYSSSHQSQFGNIAIIDELEENKKLLDEMDFGEVEKPKDFVLPSANFFQDPPKDNKKSKVNEELLDKKIADLLDKLAMFKIEGDVVRTYTGPVVTTFEFKPAPNVKVSKILNLQDDLAMALKAETIRIQAPIPGKDVIGIEVPNEIVQTIYMREILESDVFKNASSALTLILGKDIVGKPFLTDLKKLPHLLIAGTTGSGKSVGINAMILSLLYKNSPDNLKLIMIDPKMLEFSIYNEIPHLLTPVITKPSEAINALSNAVLEMERRYMKMSQTKTKNIENYNEKAKKDGFEPFPYIVIIIDELADLMMTSGKDVELSIARLAQMARASGIHLIVATQRPSVDVVTGLIKANLPSRISYKVGQRIDSKIILDSMGAESLLGRGDMLFTPPGSPGLVRIHAPWSTEDEIDKVVEFLKSQREAKYNIDFLRDINSGGIGGSSQSNLDEIDELYNEAKDIVINERKSSISYLQRRLKIGYNRAATIVEQLEQTGILSAPNSKGNREIL